MQKIYLAGETGVFASGDRGRTWARASEGLPEGPVTALAVDTTPPETVFAAVQDRVWASSDGGQTWSAPTPSGISNPSTRFFIRRLQSGKLLLVKNGPVSAR